MSFEASVFLAQCMGIILPVTAIGMIINRQAVSDMIPRESMNREFVFIVSLIRIIFGAILLTVQHTFASRWEGLLTVVIALIFLSGLAGFWFPVQVQRFIRLLRVTTVGIVVSAVILAAIGAAFFWVGRL